MLAVRLEPDTETVCVALGPLPSTYVKPDIEVGSVEIDGVEPPAFSYVTDILDKYIACELDEPVIVTTILPEVTFKLFAVYVAEEVVSEPLLTELPPTEMSYEAVVDVVYAVIETAVIFFPVPKLEIGVSIVQSVVCGFFLSQLVF